MHSLVKRISTRSKSRVWRVAQNYQEPNYYCNGRNLSKSQPNTLNFVSKSKTPIKKIKNEAKNSEVEASLKVNGFVRNKTNKKRKKKAKPERKMAGLFDKQADLYLDARPDYPSDWFPKLADLTHHHGLAWDVGTGNGQAALGVADHYERVIATDVSESQLKLATPHPKIEYRHAPLSMTDDELVELIGGENSVDLITVAQAVHWFDLSRFYAVATRLLRKPGGIIAVWGYNNMIVSPEFDTVKYRFLAETMPFWKYPNIQHVFDSYKALPFPFESVGMGSEGQPLELKMPKTTSFEGILRMFKSYSAIVTAKEKGIDLLPESMVKELENAWGGPDLIRPVVYKAFMIAGKVRFK